MTELTPDEARDQLAAAETLAGSSGADARIGAFITAAVGLLVAGALAMSNAFSRSNPMAASIGFGVYAVALAGLMLWHGRHVRVSKRGWGIRYVASLALTMSLYGIGIAWSTSGSPSWAVFAPYCVVVALPMVLVAVRNVRR